MILCGEEKKRLLKGAFCLIEDRIGIVESWVGLGRVGLR